MEIFYDLTPQAVQSQLVLTIGNFDGIHLGHRRLFEQINLLSNHLQAPKAIISFENHPSFVLSTRTPVELISTPQHKIQLIEQAGFDYLALLQFTQEFSLQTPEQFLDKVYQALPFRYLVLGHDAKIGKDKAGDRVRVEKHLKKWNAEVVYLEPVQLQGQVVSSSLIRQMIQAGELDKASLYLGRKYSILAPVVKGLARGRQIGFPTLNFDLKGLCLPPQGVYAVQAKYRDRIWNGVANLGKAPTIRQDAKIALEVHLLDFDQQIYGEWVEIFFESYLRGEKQFSDIKQLQNQIQEDIRRILT